MEQRITDLERHVADIHDSLKCGSERMGRIEDDLAHNTQTTREIRELLEMGRAGLRILGYIGAVARWAAPIVGLCAAAYGWWQAIKGGHPPSK